MNTQKGLQVRRRIVDAANRLFYERGYSQTSFSDIADAADVPRGNFYYHFKSKDEILGAVILSRGASIGAMLDAWQQEIPGPRERLNRFVQIMLNEAQSVMRYGCPIGSLTMELSKTQSGLHAQAGQLFDLFREWLQQQFAALGKGDASHGLALQLLAQTQGAALISNVYKDGAFMACEAQRLAQWLDEL